MIVRTGAQMARVLADNPFASAAPNRTVAIFLDAPRPKAGRRRSAAAGTKSSR